MTYELVSTAWMICPFNRQWGSAVTALALTEDLRIFEFISCLDRPSVNTAGRTLYLIYNECAMDFYLGRWWDGAPIDDRLQRDSTFPLAHWQVDPLRGPKALGSPARPFDLRDMYDAAMAPLNAKAMEMAGVKPPEPEMEPSLVDGQTWAEATVEEAATAILNGTYKLPDGSGNGDSTRASEAAKRGWW